jgi:DNA-binding SARP family transcriptional activator
VSAGAQRSAETPTASPGPPERPDAAVSASLEFRLLGPLEVRRGGEPLALGGARPRALLAFLLLGRGRVLSVDELVEGLWGESPPRTARHMVEVYVSKLRKLLGERVLWTRPPGYLLQPQPERVDSERFERLLGEGGEALACADPARAAATLAQALALWRGPALADFSYEPFAQAEIARLEELRLVALEERIEAELALGRQAELVGELEALVAKHPFRERPRGQLMLALYRAGRQADALAAYQETRKLLVEELGIEPSPSLQRLEGAILRQEPELEEPAAAASVGAAPSVVTPQPPRAVRRTVTVAAFGLAHPASSLDPEALRRLRRRLATAVSEAACLHGGAVARSEQSESLVAVFGIPTLHEDDALRAVRAALEVHGQELPLRAGVDTGAVVVRAGEPIGDLLASELVESAMRLRDAAAAGEILLGEATRNLIGEAGRAEPTDSGWRLHELVPGVAPGGRQFDLPLVGRGDELAQLRDLLARAVHARAVHLVTVIGVAGVGKSRLARELGARVGRETRLLTGRCLSYGEGITYWPLRDLVQEAAGEVTREGVLMLLTDADDAAAVADRLATALGLADPGWTSQEEIFWAVRRLLETLAQTRPLVLVLEDLHWAESTFLDLVEYLAEWTRDAPILLLCLARPELLEERARWGGGTPNAASLLLEPLSPAESEALLDELLDGSPLAAAARARITETAEGNPLFLEQLLAMVAQGEELGVELPAPPTVEALLAARLDRLGPGEQAVLEGASIVGKEFSVEALAELLPEPGRRTAPRHLTALARKQLVRTIRAAQGGEAFRFGHILIQQAAYRSMPKELQADLHERFAEWLIATAAEEFGEIEELVGYQLEQASLRLAELGSSSARARALADRGSDLLAAAAHRAAARGDDQAAANLLRRARALLPPGDPRLPILGVALAEALGSVGEIKEAEALSREAMQTAAARGDKRTEWLAAYHNIFLRDLLEPVNVDEFRQTADQALAVFEELGDDQGLARAWELIAWEDWNACRFGAAAKAYERGLAHARRSEDERARLILTGHLNAALYHGPTPAPEAIARIEELMTQAGGGAFEARALVPLAGLHTMQGYFDEGRALYERSKSIRRELGLRLSLAIGTVSAREIHLLAGDVEEAEHELRWGYETLEQMGEKGVRSTLAASLAEALYRLRRYEEAGYFARAGLEAASPEDIASQVTGRMVTAKLLAVKGTGDRAERTAREAVAIAEMTDDLFTRGQANLALAEVLLLANRREGAIEALEAAVEASDRKGNIVTAEQARALLAGL